MSCEIFDLIDVGLPQCCIRNSIYSLSSASYIVTSGGNRSAADRWTQHGCLAHHVVVRERQRQNIS